MFPLFRYNVVRYAIKNPELDLNVLGSFRWTPLGHAAHDSNVDIVKLLLQRNDIQINAVRPGEDSPLWLTVKCGRTKVVSLLLKQGKRLNINSQNNKDGESALSTAASLSTHREGHLRGFPNRPQCCR